MAKHKKKHRTAGSRRKEARRQRLEKLRRLHLETRNPHEVRL